MAHDWMTCATLYVTELHLQSDDATNTVAAVD
jgi:hypothetical protein